MSRFDDQTRDYEDNFIRHSPSMLNNMFGTSDASAFWVADMDFQIAEPIRAELDRLAKRGRFAYEFDSGRVFEAITGWFKRRHDLNLDAEKFVQLPGVLTGIALLIRELTKTGEKVLIQTPSFHQFPGLIENAGRVIEASPLRLTGDRYEMDFDDLAAKFAAPELTAMILCNPHNPVGRVWTREELERLVALADAHQVAVISDEIHAGIIYAPHKFTSLMAVDGGKHAAVIGSPAKTFGMQSISNGYVYSANEDLRKGLKATADAMVLGHGNAFTTYATIAAFSEGDAWLDELLAYLSENVAWITQFANDNLPGVRVFPVEGTYQVWLDFAPAGISRDDLAAVMTEAKVAITPGAWFRSAEGTFARVNIASPRAEIASAFERLKNALDAR